MRDPKLFVALDVDDPGRAAELARDLEHPGIGFKVGPRLILREGARLVQKIAQHGPVFVDCKHLDIPSTMTSAVRAAFESGASYATVHAWSGPTALRELAELEVRLNRERHFRVLVVSVLTSFSPDTLPFGLKGRDIGEDVLGLAQEAQACGLKAFVCSPHEASALRRAISDAFIITPGVRPSGSDKGDQVRVETPQAAALHGASGMVVGRPIIEAPEPRSAALQILREFTGEAVTT